MTAAVIFTLYAISSGDLPDFTALGAFQSKQACVSAAQEVEKALGSEEHPRMLLCVSSESLSKLATENGAGK